MSSAKCSFIFFPPGNSCDIRSTNLAFVALLILVKIGKRINLEFGDYIFVLGSKTVGNVSCFCLNIHMGNGRRHVKMFRAPKVHSPFPTEHSLPGAKLLWFKNLTWTRRSMHITFKISLNVLECKKCHQSLQDFLR